MATTVNILIMICNTEFSHVRFGETKTIRHSVKASKSPWNARISETTAVTKRVVCRLIMYLKKEKSVACARIVLLQLPLSSEEALWRVSEAVISRELLA